MGNVIENFWELIREEYSEIMANQGCCMHVCIHDMYVSIIGDLLYR